MRRAFVLLAVASCGARTDLGASVSHTSHAGCTDALDPAAFMRVERYCSDGSRRSPATAPLHPHIAWTQSLDDELGYESPLVVDRTGTLFVGFSTTLRAFAPTGAVMWTADFPGFLQASFIPSEGNAIRVFSDMLDAQDNSTVLVALSTIDGTKLSSSGSPNAYAHVVANPDGTYFADVLQASPFGSNFGGVARLASDASVQWLERGNCATGESDRPAPHDFVRSGDELVMACRTTNGGTEVLSVNASDEKSFDVMFDGDLASDVALLPSGDVVFFTTIDQTNASLVDIGPGATSTSVGGPTIETPARLAIAANETLVIATQRELIAFANNAVSWRIPNLGATDLFVDRGATIVVTTATGVRGVDVASGGVVWALDIPNTDGNAPVKIASGGPGRIYVVHANALTLIED